VPEGSRHKMDTRRQCFMTLELMETLIFSTQSNVEHCGKRSPSSHPCHGSRSQESGAILLRSMPNGYQIYLYIDEDVQLGFLSFFKQFEVVFPGAPSLCESVRRRSICSRITWKLKISSDIELLMQ
jgi:hypothetical protein